MLIYLGGVVVVVFTNSTPERLGVTFLFLYIWYSRRTTVNMDVCIAKSIVVLGR